MVSFLKRRIVVEVIGLVLVALFVWFVGEYLSFGFGENIAYPLQSVTARLVTITLVVGVWALWKIFRRMRSRRSNDQLMAAVAQPVADPRPTAEATQLRERFEESVAALRRGQSGKASLYELPWYVIIGAPGSGKTTALVNSGLRFPVEQRTGKGAVRGVGGTRNCDWWFTDEAVLLDTAGRYTTQDSDRDADSAGWSEFLTLLTKYRGRRPLNGVLVAISAHDLLTQGAAGREEHVAAVRRRLEELTRQLKVQLPVYLLLTKCDLVAGFTEYFDDLTPEARAQVWGTTFPYEETADGSAARRLPVEIDALVERLNSRVYERLQAERNPQRRTRIFGFPQQVATLREPLSEFVSDVFGSTRFEGRVLLRGVYLTSGTQEGTPIDRLLGALGRRLAAAPDAVQRAGRGKAYFIQRALRDVVFAEAGLAGFNRRLEMRLAAWQVAAYAAIAAATVITLVGLGISYRRNQSYLAEVANQVEQLREVPPVGTQASLDAVLPRLDAVRAVSDGATAHRAGSTWSMRWGLYQGGIIGDAALAAYVRELDDTLRPSVASRLEERLRDPSPQLELLYQYLKAYLMLGEPARLEKQQLAFIANDEWTQATNAETATRLSAHFSTLLDDAEGLSPIAVDDTLVAQARTTIGRAEIPRLAYRELRLRFVDDDGSALRLDVASGTGTDRVLRRKSGVPLSRPVPGIYTAAVFKQVTGRNTEQVVLELLKDRWVLGVGLSDIRPGNLVAQVTTIYEDDYITFWDGVLRDIDVIPLGSLERAQDVLEVLARPTSPFRGFLKAVDDQTYLVQPAAPASSNGLTNRVEALIGRGKRAIGIKPVTAGARVTAHFAELHRLVTGEAGGAPIDAVIRRLEELQKQVSGMGSQVGGVSPTDAGAVARVGAIAKSLELDAAQLPPEIGSVLAKVAAGTSAATRGGLRGNLSARYQADVVGRCFEIIGKYPFNAASAADLPLEDFSSVFGPGGVYDEFFKSELTELVDTARRPWAWRRDESGASVGGALPLTQFESAVRIRDAFFRDGAGGPAVAFTLYPINLDDAVGRVILDVHGFPLEYEHGLQRAISMEWPGKRPGPASVTLELLKGGGRQVIEQPGPWAWFRLLDAAQVQPEAGSDTRFLVTFGRPGGSVFFRLDAARGRNPFREPLLRNFRCS